MPQDPIRENIGRLTAAADALLDAVSVEKRTGRLAAELEERGYGPRGPFRYAPLNILEQQRREIHGALDRVAGERLADVEKAVREDLQDIVLIEAHARRAPPDLAAEVAPVPDGAAPLPGEAPRRRGRG